MYFDTEIGQILQRHCSVCHSENTIGMPLTTYREVRPWARAIKVQVLEHLMPPWRAVPGYGDFENAAQLTTREVDELVAWVDGGAPLGKEDIFAGTKAWMVSEDRIPEGTDVEPRAPRADSVIKPGSPSALSANGGFAVKRVPLATGLREDRWVRAVSFTPGDSRVVRGAFLYLDEQLVGGWTPQYARLAFPEGVGLLLPEQAELELELHYQSLRESTEDSSQLGLEFLDRAPRNRVGSLSIESSTGEGGARTAKASALLPENSTIIALRPRLGEAGGSVAVTSHEPGGAVRILLWIKAFSLEWQTPYVLDTPLRLPGGTRLQVEAHSSENAQTNPDVSFGLDVIYYQ